MLSELELEVVQLLLEVSKSETNCLAFVVALILDL